LLGAFDWDSLVTRADNHYEPGVFDLRGPFPRPTALAPMLGELAAGRVPSHPVLAAPGWWRRPERVLYPAPLGRTRVPARIRGGSDDAVPDEPDRPGRSRGRPLLITGARGTLGRTFARICDERGLACRVVTRAEMDMAVDASVDAMLNQTRPWAVVNAAGYVRVDDAQREPGPCFRENTAGPVTLARQCAARGIPFVTFSSDLVFDGAKRTPYVESDPVAPLNVYGRTKALAEAQVLQALPTALVVRTSAFFGPWDEYNFVTIVLRELQAGRGFVAADDATVSPTYVPDLVNASLDLLIDGEGGLWHLASVGAVTWADLARDVARRAGLDAGAVEGRSTADLRLPAGRPLYSVLGSQRGSIMPALEDALERYARDRPVDVMRSVGSR
jgi:dTDP-4-dehydrorhamnose reductase